MSKLPPKTELALSQLVDCIVDEIKPRDTCSINAYKDDRMAFFILLSNVEKNFKLTEGEQGQVVAYPDYLLANPFFEVIALFFTLIKDSLNITARDALNLVYHRLSSNIDLLDEKTTHIRTTHLHKEGHC